MSDAGSCFYVYFPVSLIECISRNLKKRGYMMNRRKRKRRGNMSLRQNRRNTEGGGNLATAVIVICLSLAAGYFAAAYVVGPLLGLDTAPLVFNEQKAGDKKDNVKAEEKEDLEPDGTEGLAESGYVLQYGSFSSKEAAENCVNELSRSGIEAEIIEKDGAYKVISPLFDTEQEARVKMETQKNYVDVFITHFP